jgi:hypothetical protein
MTGSYRHICRHNGRQHPHQVRLTTPACGPWILCAPRSATYSRDCGHGGTKATSGVGMTLESGGSNARCRQRRCRIGQRAAAKIGTFRPNSRSIGHHSLGTSRRRWRSTSGPPTQSDIFAINCTASANVGRLNWSACTRPGHSMAAAWRDFAHEPTLKLQAFARRAGAQKKRPKGSDMRRLVTPLIIVAVVGFAMGAVYRYLWDDRAPRPSGPERSFKVARRLPCSLVSAHSTMTAQAMRSPALPAGSVL